MITIKALDKEIDEILDKNKYVLKPREHSRLSNRLLFLNKCKTYMEGKPTEEFLQKELDRLNNRLKLVMESQPKVSDPDNPIEKKILEKHMLKWATPEIKYHIKTITFLLNKK